MTRELHTVVETPDFVAQARKILSPDEHEALIAFVAANPKAGVVIRGTGGARKFRFAARGKGKSGGARVVSFYSGVDLPVFLLDIYGKDEKDNLTQSERNELRAVLGQLAELYLARRNRK